MAKRLFKPMLADPADFNLLRFPLMASFKLDGIRATIHDGVAMSRSMKPLPNAFLQDWLRGRPDLNGTDGEFIVGNPTEKDAFRTTTSYVMSNDKARFPFCFYVFDRHDMEDEAFEDRLRVTQQMFIPRRFDALQTADILDQTLVGSIESLEAFEMQALGLGYEGVMTRDPHALYKQGRSTANGQELTKIKRASDMEGVVVGTEELMHNANERFTNELGRGQRSSAKGGKVGLKALGALTVLGLPGSPFDGVAFNVGGGFDAKERIDLWLVREALIGRVCKVKYFHIGAMDKPRHPVFLGWRDTRDMG